MIRDTFFVVLNPHTKKTKSQKKGSRIMIRDHTGTTREPQGKTNKKKAAFTDSLTGEKWDSNPRPSEPQSDALTN